MAAGSPEILEFSHTTSFLVEKECKLKNFSHVLLDVRETQKRAIKLYEQIGYKLWGELPVYHKLENKKMVSGKYYYKDLGES